MLPDREAGLVVTSRTEYDRKSRQCKVEFLGLKVSHLLTLYTYNLW
jgi:hypothetical protein